MEPQLPKTAEVPQRGESPLFLYCRAFAAGMGPFVDLLAIETAFGGRVGLQTLQGNRLSAVDAFAIGLVGDAQQCCIDITNFLNLPADVRVVDIDQQIGERFIGNVMDAAGQFLIAFIVGAQQILANLFAQLQIQVFQLLFKFIELLFR